MNFRSLSVSVVKAAFRCGVSHAPAFIRDLLYKRKPQLKGNDERVLALASSGGFLRTSSFERTDGSFFIPRMSALKEVEMVLVALERLVGTAAKALVLFIMVCFLAVGGWQMIIFRPFVMGGFLLTVVHWSLFS